MKKIFTMLMVLLISLSSLFCASSSSFSFSNLLESPLYSPSFNGSYEDTLVSPSAMHFRTDEYVFFSTVRFSEHYSASAWRENLKLPYINNYRNEYIFSFMSRYIALNVINSLYVNTESRSNETLYASFLNDISISLNLSWGISFFSAGLSLDGGTTLVRENRRVDGIADLVSNAYFSSYSTLEGSDFFSIGFSLSFDFDYIAFTYQLDKLATLENNRIYSDGNLIVDNMVMSIALSYPEYTSRGNLNLFSPRVSYTIKGNPAGEYSLYASADLKFNLLPDFYFSLAAGYSETDHRFFIFRPENGMLSFSFSLSYERYYFMLGLNMDTASFEHYYPYISFTFAL